MRLEDLAEVARIRVGLRAATREDAIDELLALLEHDGQLEPALRILARDSVLAREVVQSTGMTHGVALPHGPVAGIGDVMVAIGTRTEGIAWPCQDGNTVSIVVLLLVPENRYQVHVRTLAAIARLLNDRRLRERVEQAESPAALSAALAEWGGL